MPVEIFHRLDPATAAAKGRIACTVRRLLEQRPAVQSVIVGYRPLSQTGYRWVRPPRNSDLLYYCLNLATNHRGRRLTPVRLEPAEFPGLREALAFAQKRILPTRHSFLIHAVEAGGPAVGDPMRVQVVDRNRVLGDGDWRMLAHLAFDPACDRLGPLANLLGSGRAGELLEYRLGGVPCYGLPLEGEPGAMAEAMEGLLEAVHGRPAPGGFIVRVHDEGPLRAAGEHVVAHTSGTLAPSTPELPRSQIEGRWRA